MTGQDFLFMWIRKCQSTKYSRAQQQEENFLITQVDLIWPDNSADRRHESPTESKATKSDLCPNITSLWKQQHRLHNEGACWFLSFLVSINRNSNTPARRDSCPRCPWLRRTPSCLWRPAPSPPCCPAPRTAAGPRRSVCHRARTTLVNVHCESHGLMPALNLCLILLNLNVADYHPPQARPGV